MDDIYTGSKNKYDTLSYKWNTTIKKGELPNSYSASSTAELVLQHQSFIDSITKQFSLLLNQINILKDKINSFETTFSVQIFDLSSDKYSLKCPMSVIVNKEGELFLAEFIDFDLYGEGDDVKSSIDDLKMVLIEYYEEVLKQKKLSKSLEQKMKLLKNFINEI